LLKECKNNSTFAIRFCNPIAIMSRNLTLLWQICLTVLHPQAADPAIKAEKRAR
jgi:hypothetical protein